MKYLYRNCEDVLLIKMGKIWSEVKDTVGNTMYVLNRYLKPKEDKP